MLDLLLSRFLLFFFPRIYVSFRSFTWISSSSDDDEHSWSGTSMYTSLAGPVPLPHSSTNMWWWKFAGATGSWQWIPASWQPFRPGEADLRVKSPGDVSVKVIFWVEEEEGGVEVVDVAVQPWLRGDIFSSILSKTWLATIELSLSVIAPSWSDTSWLTAAWVDQLGLWLGLNLGFGLAGAGVMRSLAGRGATRPTGPAFEHFYCFLLEFLDVFSFTYLALYRNPSLYVGLSSGQSGHSGRVPPASDALLGGSSLSGRLSFLASASFHGGS